MAVRPYRWWLWRAGPSCYFDRGWCGGGALGFSLLLWVVGTIFVLPKCNTTLLWPSNVTKGENVSSPRGSSTNVTTVSPTTEKAALRHLAGESIARGVVVDGNGGGGGGGGGDHRGTAPPSDAPPSSSSSPLLLLPSAVDVKLPSFIEQLKNRFRSRRSVSAPAEMETARELVYMPSDKAFTIVVNPYGVGSLKAIPTGRFTKVSGWNGVEFWYLLCGLTLEDDIWGPSCLGAVDSLPLASLFAERQIVVQVGYDRLEALFRNLEGFGKEVGKARRKISTILVDCIPPGFLDDGRCRADLELMYDPGLDYPPYNVQGAFKGYRVTWSDRSYTCYTPERITLPGSTKLSYLSEYKWTNAKEEHGFVLWSSKRGLFLVPDYLQEDPLRENEDKALTVNGVTEVTKIILSPKRSMEVHSYSLAVSCGRQGSPTIIKSMYDNENKITVSVVELDNRAVFDTSDPIDRTTPTVILRVLRSSRRATPQRRGHARLSPSAERQPRLVRTGKVRPQRVQEINFWTIECWNYSNKSAAKNCASFILPYILKAREVYVTAREINDLEWGAIVLDLVGEVNLSTQLETRFRRQNAKFLLETTKPGSLQMTYREINGENIETPVSMSLYHLYKEIEGAAFWSYWSYGDRMCLLGLYAKYDAEQWVFKLDTGEVWIPETKGIVEVSFRLIGAFYWHHIDGKKTGHALQLPRVNKLSLVPERGVDMAHLKCQYPYEDAQAGKPMTWSRRSVTVKVTNGKPLVPPALARRPSFARQVTVPGPSRDDAAAE